jgi:hypothetical protein
MILAKIFSGVTARRTYALIATSLAAGCGHDMTGLRPGPDPRTIDLAFCGAPDWVAFQDGDGAWTRGTPTTSGQIATYHRTFTTDRAGVAVARSAAGGPSTIAILYGKPDELSIVEDTAAVACGNTSFKTLRGTVVGIDADEIVRLNAGRGAEGAFVSIGTGPDFTIRGLSAGPHDLLATRLRLVDGRPTLTGIILRRTPDLSDDATLEPIDFTSAEAFAPVTHTLTLTGPDNDGATGFVGLRTVHGIADELATLTGGATTTQYVAIADEHLVMGDLHTITMTSKPSTEGAVRSTSVYFRSARDRSLAFGAVPASPDISVASPAPMLRMRARFPADPDYDRVTAMAYQQGQRTVVAVRMTAAYAASNATGYDLVVPDFAGVDGFDAQWALMPGQPLLWTAVRIGGTLGVGLNAVPVDGSTSVTATRSGTFNP